MSNSDILKGKDLITFTRCFGNYLKVFILFQYIQFVFNSFVWH